MAALDFPSSPTLNQIYSANGKSWIWDGSAWNPYGGISSAMILLASATASDSAEILFDNVFNPSLYAEYELRFKSVAPATDNVAIRIVFRDSSGVDMTSTYRWGQAAVRIDATFAGNTSNNNSTAGYSILATAGNAANERNSGRFTISPTASWWTVFHAETYTTSTAADRYLIRHTGAYEDTTTAPAGLRIFCSSGNISIGTFQLYGIKK